MLRDFLKRFRRFLNLKQKEEMINPGQRVQEISDLIDLEILQDDKLLDSLKSARILDIELEHWRRFYTLRRYETAALLEERRIRRRIPESYVA